MFIQKLSVCLMLIQKLSVCLTSNAVKAELGVRTEVICLSDIKDDESGNSL